MFESISNDSFFIRTATCLVSLSRYGQVNSMISSMSVTGSFFFSSTKLTISVILITVIVSVYSPHYMLLSVNLQPSGT